MTLLHDIIVIGGSQSGLSVSYWLKERGLDHVVLEQHDHVAHTWDFERWDSFTLVTPNWFNRLPAFEYAGDEPDGFLPRDRIVAYVRDYLDFVEPPIRLGVKVNRLRAAGGHYLLDTGHGEMRARNVIVATGYFHRDRIPDSAASLPFDIVQHHPYTYKNPGELPPGAVLIVGSSMSGLQICQDFVDEGRPIYMAVGGGNRVPRRYRGRDSVSWMVDLGWFDKPFDPETQAERYRASMQLSGARGGHGVNLHYFAAKGVTLAGRLKGVDGTRAFFTDDLNARVASSDAFDQNFKKAVEDYVLENGLDIPDADETNTDEGHPTEGPEYPEVTEIDLREKGIKSVTWATGYDCDYGWIDLPIFDHRGFPRQQRGVTEVPGLYFCGQHWLHTFASGVFFGVGNDAAYVAGHIKRHLDRSE